MAYQIVKGWPSTGAIDEILQSKDNAAIKLGTVVMMKNTGLIEPAAYATDGSNAADMSFFVFDEDKTSGRPATAPVRKKYLCIKSPCVIETDSSGYVAASYAANDKLSASVASPGKLCAQTGTAPVIARVISYNATTGILRVLWTGSN